MIGFFTHPDFPNLKYYPSSGNFRWTHTSCGFVKRNKVAGGRDSDGYIQIQYNRKQYKAHRMAYLFMTGGWPEHEIDHENGVTDDNKWSNLKPATDQQNARNKKIGSRNKSGHMGVMWCKVARKWQAWTHIHGIVLFQRRSHQNTQESRKETQLPSQSRKEINVIWLFP